MQFYKPKRELRSIWTENLCNRVENLKKTCISAFWHSRQYSTRSKGDRVRMNICVFDIGFFFLWTLFVVTFFPGFFLPCFLLLHDGSAWLLCSNSKADSARLQLLGLSAQLSSLLSSPSDLDRILGKCQK